MTKHLRAFSNSKVYHIIIKGIDDNDIFYDTQDKKIFLERLMSTKKEYDFKVYAYCLMSNHVHLVIEVEDEVLSTAVQSLTIRYVSYFNKKYDRRGPFVQNRFKSKNVEDQRYFIEVCRYVHRNPEKAGIEKTFNYKWSSYHEYIGKEKIIDKKVLLYYFNNDLNEFIKYTNKSDDIRELLEMGDFELKDKLTDEDVTNIILKQFKLKSVEDIHKCFKDNKNKEKIMELRNISKTNPNQLSRIIRIERRNISKIWHAKKDLGPKWHN